MLPLHGDLPPEQQDRALQKLDRRKVVLATNVAETSVTVEGVTAVVDSGLARQMEFDPSVGMDRLRLVPISRASADQRAGRAGRTQPGVCVRLWDEPGHRGRPEQTEPEIRRVDLCGAVLQLLALGEADVRELPVARRRRGRKPFSSRCGCSTNSGSLDGRRADRARAKPRPGCRFTRGSGGCCSKASGSAAPGARRWPRRCSPSATRSSASSTPARRSAPPRRRCRTCSTAWRRWRRSRRRGRLDGPLGRCTAAARRVLEVRDQLARLAGEPQQPVLSATGRDARRSPDEVALLRCVFAAYPDRLARRREPGSTRASRSAAAGCGSPRRAA